MVITHNDLVAIAGRWLRNQIRCGVVLQECSTGGAFSEPDAIGWRICGRDSHMVECKSTRRDFLKDRDKLVRRQGHLDMGNHRYYMAAVGVIKVDELPANWGLIEIPIDTRRPIVTRTPTWQAANREQEISMMYSAMLRTAANGSGRVYIVGRTYKPKKESCNANLPSPPSILLPQSPEQQTVWPKV